MFYTEALPSAGLSGLVRCYWTLEFSGSNGSDAPEPVIPDGCPEIVFNLADKFRRFESDGNSELQPKAILVGPMRRHVTLQPTGKIVLFGIRFYPAGAFPFFGFSFSELADRIESLGSVWGSKADAFEEKLGECSSFEERVGVANEELSNRLHIGYAYDSLAAEAVRAIQREKGLISIDILSAEFGISGRQLERKFNERVGLTPKVFSRIARMQNVLRVLKMNRTVNMLDLALSHGYYDQSHFIKEFREFSGQTPLEFLNAQQQLSEIFIS